MIIASFSSMLRISVKDCDHRSQADVWGNNDRKHRIKPLNNISTRAIYRQCSPYNKIQFKFRVNRTKTLNLFEDKMEESAHMY